MSLCLSEMMNLMRLHGIYVGSFNQSSRGVGAATVYLIKGQAVCCTGYINEADSTRIDTQVVINTVILLDLAYAPMIICST